MKRILPLFVSIILLLAVPVSAIECTQIDSDLDTISIKGNAPSGKRITVIVLNPDYTYEDYISSDVAKRHEAIKYIKVCYADSQGYEVSPVRLDGAGTYTILANGETEQFEYFSKSSKIAVINSFNAGSDGAPKLVEVFGLKNDPLAAVEADYTQRVNVLRGDLDPADVNGASDEIYRALIMAAMDKGDESLIYTGNTFNFAEEIGLTVAGMPTSEYADYLANLNNKGILAVKSGLNKEMPSCDNFADVKSAFNNLLYVNLIMNNKYNGAGHVQGVFEKYSEYANYGINYPASADENMYIGLISSGADTMEDIKTYINNYVPFQSGGQNNGYNTPGSLGGGGSFGGSSSQITTPSDPGTVTPPVSGGSYTDLPEGHWAADAIGTLSKSNVITGYDDGSFRPEANVTRAEFAKMLVVLMGLDITDNKAYFSDVPSDDWSATYIAAAAKAGFITGNDGKFNPTDIISRQDAAIILARAADLKPAGESTFADNSEIADYAKDAAAAVQQSGLMQGMGDGTFLPLGSMTRAQAAMVFYRLSQKGVNG